MLPIFCKNKGFFNLPPGFYAAQNPTEEYDMFEKAGKCDSRCFFCSMVGYADPPSPIRRGTNSKGRSIAMCAGEPLGFDNVTEIVKDLKKKWKIVSIVTNGKRLGHKAFAKRFLGSGIDEIFFSVHGHNAAIHDRTTGVRGSFYHTLKGVHNAAAFNKNKGKVNVAFMCVLTRSNLPLLYEYLHLAAKLGVKAVCFGTLFPIGAGVNAFPRVPTYTEIVNAFSRLKKRCVDDNSVNKLRIFLMDTPFCLIQNLARDKYTFLLNETSEFRDRATCQKYRHICKRCALDYSCMGIFREYVTVYGINEFKPIPKNSLFYREWKKASKAKH